MGLKVGDLVRIKDLEDVLKLEEAEDIRKVKNPGIIKEMVHMFGKNYTIAEVCEESGNIFMEGNESKWEFKDQWLDKVEVPSREPLEEVKKAPHYNQGKYEVIDVLEDWLTEEEFIGFCKGNVIKYNARALYKEDPSTDYAKAKYYQDKINEIYEK